MVSVANRDIDVAGLRKLYSSNTMAKHAFDEFAHRTNNSKVTTVDRLQALLRAQRHDISRTDIVEFFRALEATGCGSFLIGRKGHPSRFEWLVGLTDVGQAASGASVSVEPISATETVEEPSEIGSPELRERRYWLRSDLELSLLLPVDLSTAEAARLADHIRTLPIE